MCFKKGMFEETFLKERRRTKRRGQEKKANLRKKGNRTRRFVKEMLTEMKTKT